jgi:hypothetical protein
MQYPPGEVEARIVRQAVEHRDRAHEQRVAALARLVEAEASDHVRRVGVEGLPLVRLVDPDVRVPAIGADVADVPSRSPYPTLITPTLTSTPSPTFPTTPSSIPP